MKKLYLFLYFLIFSHCFAFAQTLTGVWQGYFYSDGSFGEDSYKYEVQLNHISDKSIKGVTYSYQEKSFYGKADLQGSYFKTTHNLVIAEKKMLELNMPSGGNALLMTCYLTYSRIGNVDYLNGTYSSVDVKSGLAAGGGKVFLQKVDKSDFIKEPFLLKRNIKPSTKPVIKPKPTNPSTNLATVASPPNVKIPIRNSDSSSPASTTPPIENKIPVGIPFVIKNRENKLVKNIETNSPDIKIELYDNGEIDGDTITVYNNLNIIADKKRLTSKPITLNIKATKNNPVNEFILVANNLGSIPPNTALMVITTGGKRYELFIGTDEKKNAKVVITYKE